MRFRFPMFLAIGFILIFTAVGPVHGASQPAPDFSADFVPGELIVGFKQSNLMQSFSMPSGVQAAKDSPRLSALNAVIVDVPAGKEAAYRSELMRSDSVLFVEPNYIVTAADVTPNDPLWGSSSYLSAGQWDMERIGAPRAWDTTQGSSSVVLAVLELGY